MISRLALAALAATALAVAASTALGDAQSVRVESKITMRYGHCCAGGYYFKGRVKADQDACERHRDVKLYARKRSEQHRTHVEDTSTNRQGEWSRWTHTLAGQDQVVSYFAVVTREKKRGYVCTRDKSKEVTRFR